jgi:hypothetical protein
VFYLSVKLGCGVAGKSNIELKKLKLKWNHARGYGRGKWFRIFDKKVNGFADEYDAWEMTAATFNEESKIAYRFPL